MSRVELTMARVEWFAKLHEAYARGDRAFIRRTLGDEGACAYFQQRKAGDVVQHTLNGLILASAAGVSHTEAFAR